jgi:hypothetical protein
LLLLLLLKAGDLYLGSARRVCFACGPALGCGFGGVPAAVAADVPDVVGVVAPAPVPVPSGIDVDAPVGVVGVGMRDAALWTAPVLVARPRRLSLLSRAIDVSTPFSGVVCENNLTGWCVLPSSARVLRLWGPPTFPLSRFDGR